MEFGIGFIVSLLLLRVSGEGFTGISGGIALPFRNLQPVNASSLLSGTTRLPCDLRSPNVTDRVVLVLWFRADSDTPIYSVDARDVEIRRAGHWSEETAFGRRARFMWHESPAYLAVEAVKKEDTGVYRCRVDYRTAQTKNLLVSLKVIVPPSPPRILDETGGIIRSVAGPYLEGESLKLTCESKGGDPPPRLIWYRDGERWDTTDHPTLNGTIRNDVILARLRRDDLNTILSCEASNNNETVPASSFVLVDMLLSPLEVQMLEGREQIFSANKEARFVCRSSGSRPPAAITWWLGGYRVSGSHDVVAQNGNSTTSSLSLTLQTEHAGKLLVCRAENLRLRVSPMETGTILNMLYPPSLSVSFGKNLAGKSLKEGDDVYFECEVVANPAPLRVEWKHNGQRVSQNITGGIIISDRSIVLQKVNRNQIGRYTCAAWNDQGGSESEPLQLSLQYVPVCSVTQPIVRMFTIGDEAELKCPVDGDPKPTFFRWMMNSTSDFIDLSGSGDEIFRWKVNSEHDLGDVLCWSHNELGQQSEPCLFHLLLAGKPESIRNCTVVNQTANSAFISCIEGFNGGLATWFTLNLYDATQSRSILNVTNDDPHFLISQLEPATEYRVTIASANQYGVGGFRSFTVHTPAETASVDTVSLTAEASRPNLTWSPAVSTALAVSVASVFIFLTLCIVMKRRKAPRGDAAQQNILPRANPASHATEIHSYHTYYAPERGKQTPQITVTDGDCLKSSVSSKSTIQQTIPVPSAVVDVGGKSSGGRVVTVPQSHVLDPAECVSLLSVVTPSELNEIKPHSTRPTSYCTVQRKPGPKTRVPEINSYKHDQKTKLPHLVEEIIKARTLRGTSDGSGKSITDGALNMPKNAVRLGLSDGLSASIRLPSLVPEVMYIMLDAREVLSDSESSSEDIQLCRIAFSTFFKSDPSFSTDRSKPYKIVKGDVRIEYWILDCTKQPRIPRPPERYTRKLSSYDDYPEQGSLRISFNGEVQTACGFEGKMLHVNYLIDISTCCPNLSLGYVQPSTTVRVKTILSNGSPYIKGSTQRCRNRNGNTIFAHPFDAQFTITESDFSGKDGGANEIQGYGYVVLLVRPGGSSSTIHTWKPVLEGTTQRLFNVAARRHLVLPDLRMLSEPGDFQEKFLVPEKVTTISTGIVSLTINMMIQSSCAKESLGLPLGLCQEEEEEQIEVDNLSIEAVIQTFQEARKRLWVAIEKLKTL